MFKLKWIKLLTNFYGDRIMFKTSGFTYSLADYLLNIDKKFKNFEKQVL